MLARQTYGAQECGSIAIRSSALYSQLAAVTRLTGCGWQREDQAGKRQLIEAPEGWDWESQKLHTQKRRLLTMPPCWGTETRLRKHCCRLQFKDMAETHKH